MKTYLPTEKDIKRKIYLMDAAGQTLGRLATRIASLLIGKGKTIFVKDQLVGDQVVVINASQIRVTGKKVTQKIYKHYSGWPAGQKTYTFEELLQKKPEEIITRAVSRMLPKNKLGAKMHRRLRVYAGSEHDQKAQEPIVLKV